MRFSIASAVVGAVVTANSATAAICGIKDITAQEDCVNQRYATSVIATDTAFSSFSWSGVGATFSEPNKFTSSVLVDYDNTKCNSSVTINLDCGDDNPVTKEFTFADTKAPVIQGLYVTDITVERGDVPAFPVGVKGYDACKGAVTVTPDQDYTEDESDVITRTWTVEDDCNNTNSVTQVITVQDTTPPVFIVQPENHTADANNIPEACEVQAFDLDPGMTTVPSEDKPEFDQTAECTNGIEIVRTWNATDTSGNFETFSQTITLVDISPPVFKGTHDDITVSCDAIPEEQKLEVHDEIGGDVTATSEVDTVTVVPGTPSSYTLERTWTAKDKCNLSTTVKQLITVVDETPPVFADYDDEITVECDAVTDEICNYEAYDTCGEVDVDPKEETTPSGVCDVEFTKTVTYVATNDNNLTTTKIQTIHVVDTTAPKFDLIVPNLTTECIENVNYVVECSDNCDTTCTVVHTIDGDEWKYTAVDQCGNDVTHIATITVKDEEDPILVNIPNNETVSCDVVESALSNNVSATDNCADVGSVEPSTITQNVNCEHSYEIVNTFTVTDASNNSASESQTITVVDNTPPTFVGELETSAEVSCEEVKPAVQLSAQDNCTVNLTVIFEEETQPTECDDNYTLVRTWYSVDDCANEVRHTATISVVDKTDPEIDIAENVLDKTYACHQFDDQPKTEAELKALITRKWDNCATEAQIEEKLTVSYTKVDSYVHPDLDEACNHNYQYEAVYNFEDNCGNKVSSVHKVTFEDKDLPTIVCTDVENSAEVTLEYPDDYNNPDYALTPPVDDTCSKGTEVKLVTDHTTVPMPCHESKIIKRWYAEDDCGNKSNTCVQTITTLDTIPCVIDTRHTNAADIENKNLLCSDPELDSLVDVVHFCDPDQDYLDSNGASGNCRRLTENYTKDTENYLNVDYGPSTNAFDKTYTKTWTVWDDCDLVCSHVQTISVYDDEDPYVKDPTDIETVTIELTSEKSGFEPEQLYTAYTIEIEDNCDAPKNVTGTINYTIGAAYPNRVLKTSDDDYETYYEMYQVFTTKDINNNDLTAVQTIKVLDKSPPTINCPVDFTNACDQVVTPEDRIVNDVSFDLYGKNEDNYLYEKDPQTMGSQQWFKIDGVLQETCEDTGYVLYSDKVTDVNGQTFECSFKQYFYDDEGPTFDVPVNSTYECGVDTEDTYCQDINDTTPGCISVSNFDDNCDESATWSIVDETPSDVKDNATKVAWKKVYTYVASDNCGNTTTKTRTSTFKDTKNPTITVTSNGTDSVTDKQSACYPAQKEAFVVTDECDDNKSYKTTIDDDHVENFLCGENRRGSFDNTYKWVVTDATGNTSTLTYSDSYTDNTPPTLTPSPSNLDLTLNYEVWYENFSQDPLYYNPSASITADDTCTNRNLNTNDKEMTVVCVPGTPNHSCTYAFTKTWTCTTQDNCGKISEPYIRTLTIEDNTPPEFDSSIDFNDTIDVDCFSLLNTTYTPPTLTATVYTEDVAAGNAVQNVEPSEISLNDLYVSQHCQVSEFHYSIEDDCGNVSSDVLTVQIYDNSPPEILDCPEITAPVACDDFLTNVSGTTDCTFSDNCSSDDELIVEYEEFNNFDGCNQNYQVERSYVATDSCGNFFLKDLNFTVQDNTPPEVNIPDIDETFNGSSAYPDVSVELTNCADIEIVETCGSCLSSSGDCATENADAGSGRRRLLGWATSLATVTANEFTTLSIKTANGQPKQAARIEEDAVATCLDLTDERNAQLLTRVRTERINGSSPSKVLSSCRDLCRNSESTHVGFTCPKYFPDEKKKNMREQIECVCLGYNDMNTDDGNPLVFPTEQWKNCRGAEPSTLCPGMTARGSYFEENMMLGAENYLSVYPVDGNGATGEQSVRSTGVSNINAFVSSDKFVTFVGVLNQKKTEKEARNFRIGKPDFETKFTNFKNSYKTKTRKVPEKVPLTSSVISSTGRPVVECANNYQYTQEFKVRNSLGSETVSRRTLWYEDTTPPVFSNVPINVTSAFTHLIPVEEDYSVTASDVIDGDLTSEIQFKEETLADSIINQNEFTLVRSWSVKDTCDNENTIYQTIVITDEQPNEIEFVPTHCSRLCHERTKCPTPDDVAIKIKHWADDNSYFTDERHDIIDNVCTGTYKEVYFWNATDPAGNFQTASYTITVADTSPPEFEGSILENPTRTAYPCQQPGEDDFNSGEYHQNSAAFVSVKDNCESTEDITLLYHEVDEYVHADKPGCSDRNVIRTWTALDTCGNEATVSETVRIVDSVPPTITNLVDDTTTVNCEEPPYTKEDATVEDNCSPASEIVVTLLPIPDLNPLCNFHKTTKFVWTATDECGLASSVTHTVNVQDLNPPDFEIPGTITRECTSHTDRTSVNDFPTSYTEAEGFDVDDECDETISVQDITPFDPFFNVGLSTNCIAVWTRKYEVKDTCGRTATRTQTLEITDSEDPSIDNLPQNSQGECDKDVDQSDRLAQYKATITGSDDCDADVVIDVVKKDSVDSDNTDSCVFQYTVDFEVTARDDCGNVDVQTTTHTVVDNSEPSNEELENMDGTTVDKNCTEIDSYKPLGDIGTTDVCQDPAGYGDVIPTPTTVSGDGSYTMARKYQYVLDDKCGNTKTYAYTVQFTDNTPPVITEKIADDTIDCTETIPSKTTIAAFDGCDTAVTTAVQQDDVRLAEAVCDAEKILTQTWIAEDESGNKSTHTRKLVVDDETPPYFTTDAGEAAEATPEGRRFQDIPNVECNAVPEFEDEQYGDDCSNVTYIGSRDNSDQELDNRSDKKYCEYTLVDTYSITDDCGNADSYDRTLTVVDTTPPSLTVNYKDEEYELAVAMADPNHYLQKVLQKTSKEDWMELITFHDTCGDVLIDYTTTPCSTSCTESICKVQTWTATDACGKQTTESKTVKALDTTPPAIPPQADDTVECSHPEAKQTLKAADSGEEYYSGIASNVSVIGAASKKLDVDTGSELPDDYIGSTYKVVYTYTATDHCDLSSTGTQTIWVKDDRKPEFTVTDPNDSDKTVASESELVYECNFSNPVQELAVSVDDSCVTGQQFTPDSEELVVGALEVSRTKYTWTATDNDNNGSTFISTVVVEDKVPPELQHAAGSQYLTDGTMECHEAVPMREDTTATDACDGGITTVLFDEDVTDVKKALESPAIAAKIVKATAYTWSAIDSVGNTTTKTITMTIEDNIPPVVTMEGVINHSSTDVSCDSIPVQKLDDATYLDSCDLTNASLFKDFKEDKYAGDCTHNYQLVRTYFAIDDNGNRTDFIRTLKIFDSKHPTIDSFTYTSVDSEGNQTNGLTLEVMSHPTLENNYTTEMTAECSRLPIPEDFKMKDTCTLTTTSMSETNTDGAPDGNYNYSLVRSYNGFDDCGNTIFATFTVNVSDNEKPTIDTKPQDKSVEKFSYSDMAPANMECSDNCSTKEELKLTSTQLREPMEVALRSSDSCWKHKVTYTCTDLDNHPSSHVQLITVQDKTPPTIVGACGTLAENFNEEDGVYRFEYMDMPNYDELKLEGVYATDASNDAFDETVTLTPSSNTQPTDNPHVYTEIWTYVAKDYCNLETTKTCTIESVDTTGPILPEVENLTVECDAIPEKCDMTPIGSDDSSIEPKYSETEEAGRVYNNYILKREWTAEDDANNKTTRTQFITVKDTTPPVFSRYPANETLACDCHGIPDAETVTAVDNCDADVPVAEPADVPREPNPELDVGLDGKETMIHTRTWTAEDDNGNSVTHVQTITFKDTEGPRFFPTFEENAAVTIECDQASAAELNSVIAMDNCDSDLGVIIYTNPLGDHPDKTCDEAYTMTQTWSITDHRGNETQMNRMVTIDDTHAPEAAKAVLQPQCMVNGAGQKTAIKVFEDFEFDDACGSVTKSVTCSKKPALYNSVTGLVVVDEAAESTSVSYDTDNDSIVIADGENVQISCVVQATDSCANTSAALTREYYVLESERALHSLNRCVDIVES